MFLRLPGETISQDGMDPYQLAERLSHLPTLTTPRLTLRKAVWRDARDIFAYASDPEVARYVLWDAHQNLGDARRYVRYLRQLYRRGEPSSYVIEYTATHQVIGTVGLTSCSAEHACAEVGYSLSRAFWNQGIATEALTRFIQFAFDDLGFHRVEAMHDVRNPASGRVMEKCGMHLEGILHGRIYNKREWCDVALYACVAPRASDA